MPNEVERLLVMLSRSLGAIELRPNANMSEVSLVDTVTYTRLRLTRREIDANPIPVLSCAVRWLLVQRHHIVDAGLAGAVPLGSRRFP